MNGVGVEVMALRVRERLEHWHRGAARAVTKRDLARLCGTTPRLVERAVQSLRCRGAPVGSASGHDGVMGYWWMTEAAEIDDQIRRQRRRAIRQLVTVRGLKRARRELAEQRTREPNGQVRLFT